LTDLPRRLAAEALGTALLLAAVVGSGIMGERLAGGNVAIALLANTLATGAGLVALILTLGPISGAHFNPAVSVGLWAGGRFPAREVPAYVAAQVAGAICAGAALWGIAHGSPTFDPAGGFAANGYGAHSPGGYSLGSAAACEVLLTLGFLMVIMGATDEQRAPKGFAPLAIGFALALIHLISIPVTNTSVNPARSTGVALYAGAWAVRQLWLFWLAPLVGGALGGLAYRALTEPRPSRVPLVGGARPAAPGASAAGRG